MKKLGMVFVLLGLAPSAFATSTISTLVKCTLEKPMPDYGIEVAVTQYTGPATIGREPVRTATISRFFLAPMPKLTYGPVSEILPRPGIMGGSTTYKAEGFELGLCTDCAPLEDGKIRGNLIYEVDGQRNVEQMACDIHRYLTDN